MPIELNGQNDIVRRNGNLPDEVLATKAGPSFTEDEIAYLEALPPQSKHNAAIESEEMNLVALLRPRVFLDGNKWCVLYGENIMDGVAGFGDSPILAVYDFNKAWRREVPANVF